MLGKLLTWLIRRIFGRRYEYFELQDGRYLQVKRGSATIIDVDDVPEGYRVNRSDVDADVRMFLEDASHAAQLAPTKRRSALESLNPLTILQHAVSNDILEQDVRDEPALVDADSSVEAQLKLDLVDGADVSETIAAHDDVSEDDVQDMLETEFLAKWGYNKYGEDLPDKLNTDHATDDDERVSPDTSDDTAAAGTASDGDVAAEAGRPAGNDVRDGNSISDDSAITDETSAAESTDPT